jgi:hypothetical protein
VSNTYESHIKNYIPTSFWESIEKFLKLDGNTMGMFWELGGNIKHYYKTCPRSIINSTQHSFNIELA